ncbi:GFA family protein [Pelagibacterium sp.]|uniref:GFA family protein n=1 Tax=Pelagibacterium sp. TaxID=1967288 RepID=UPI003A8F3457
MSGITKLSCDCGEVVLTLKADPFITTECHCTSCRTAATALEILPLARPMLSPNGGTQFALYRKDRVSIDKGISVLTAFRLKPESPTRRVVASCCNTPVFLEFQHGHWLSVYSSFWPEGASLAPELRTVVSDREGMADLDNDVPAGKLPTAGFYARLLGAWIAMGFKSPTIALSRPDKAISEMTA